MRRLSEAGYWILCALSEGEAHGYALAHRVDELTDGHVAVGPGTLYAALERLQAEGAIEEAGTAVVDGRHRRYYRLTGAGRRTAMDETSRRTAAVGRASSALGLA